MTTGSRVRLLALVGLLLALAGLGIWFGSLPPAPDAGSYPGKSALLADYDRYVGDRVVVDGQVTDADPVTVRVESGDEAATVRVTGVDVAVSPGDTLRVYGVVEPGGEIRALNAFAVSGWGMPYAVGVSALAGLWVLARLRRYWRIDACHVGRRGERSVAAGDRPPDG